MARHRSGGMTAIGVLNIFFGGLGILNGLFGILASCVLMFELLRMGAFDIPIARLAFALLVLATGSAGLISGIGIFVLRPGARPLSLVYGGLLIVSSLAYFFVVPVISSIGTYNASSFSDYNLGKLILFIIIYVILPVIYAPLLCMLFCKPAWKATFANSGVA